MPPSLTVGLKQGEKVPEGACKRRSTSLTVGLKLGCKHALALMQALSPSLTVGLKRMYMGKASVPTSAELLVSTPHGGLATWLMENLEVSKEMFQLHTVD